MISLLLLLIPVVLIYLLVKYKVSIDISSFFKKGFQARRGKFGVYCFCGKQGSGKTFSTVNFILKNLEMPIYSNVHLKGINYTYYNGFEELLKITDHHCIIVFDEIFSALTKSSKINAEVLAFLSQMRKKNVIFITTAQEWLEINITLRRYVRYQIDCQILNFLPFSVLIEHYRDGEQMHWSNLDNDYIAPIVATKISKMMLKVTTHYDTWEVIDSQPQAPQKIAVTPEIQVTIGDINDDLGVTGAVVPPESQAADTRAKSRLPDQTPSMSESSSSGFWEFYRKHQTTQTGQTVIPRIS